MAAGRLSNIEKQAIDKKVLPRKHKALQGVILNNLTYCNTSKNTYKIYA